MSMPAISPGPSSVPSPARAAPPAGFDAASKALSSISGGGWRVPRSSRMSVGRPSGEGVEPPDGCPAGGDGLNVVSSGEISTIFILLRTSLRPMVAPYELEDRRFYGLESVWPGRGGVKDRLFRRAAIMRGDCSSGP